MLYLFCVTGAFKIVYTISQVKKGQPIFLNYGRHDNANLLLSYGFVVTSNPADRFRVQLDMETLLVGIMLMFHAISHLHNDEHDTHVWMVVV